MLTVWAWVSGGVYKNWCLDALEGSFTGGTLNLTILGAATYMSNSQGGNQLAVGHTSVTIALVTFIAILTYHIFQQLRHTKLWKKVPKLKFMKLNKKPNTKKIVDNHINDPAESVNSVNLGLKTCYSPPTVASMAVPSYFKVVWPNIPHVVYMGGWGHAPPGKFC